MTAAVDEFAAGEPVLVGSDDARPAFVAVAADAIDGARLERLHELGRGIVVLALEAAIADRLALPAGATKGRLRVRLPFTASIDAARGIAGGWSAADRARTMRVASAPDTRPIDLTIPGHVHPVRIAGEEAGGAAAASLELARAGERRAAVALCAVVDRAGAAASLADALADRELARLPIGHADELAELARTRAARDLAVTCSLPIKAGSFTAVAHASTVGSDATVALVHGDPAARERPFVHVHAACLLGDVFGSLVCTCRAELEEAMARIVAEGAGVIVYAKPDGGSEAVCGRGRPVDAAVVAGLLERVGVRARLAAAA